MQTYVSLWFQTNPAYSLIMYSGVTPLLLAPLIANLQTAEDEADR